ncbi:MAG: hypothetical protein GY787_12930, partial [Alteromonadales bacterium]|nr:hypothetical protein [Alteromonadales bacterium]
TTAERAAIAANTAKLAGIENEATADQTDSEIETAYNNQVSIVTQVEAETGTATTVRRWTAERVKQAIAALGGGGASVWGAITGTLSNQTDLQNALNAKSATGHTHTAANVTDFDTEVGNNAAVVLNTAKISYTDAAAVALNTAKVTNATHVGEVTGATTLTVDATAITNKTEVTAASGDYVLISDISDSGNLKKALLPSSTVNYSSIAAPQLFNPDATGVSTNTDDFILNGGNRVVLVSLNGQVLDDSEYSLASNTLTVAPDNGFSATDDEVLVYQETFSTTSTGLTLAYTTKTANYTVGLDDFTIDCTANTFTVTLPAVATIVGKIYNIANTGTGVITIDGNGSELIQGSLTQTISQWENLHIQATSTGWIVL